MMNPQSERGEEVAGLESASNQQEKVTRAEKKAQSRRRILEAARDVFFRDGFMAANLDEVAEKAAVAKGTLYRYFESKADLYVAVLAHNGDVFTQRMKEVASDGSQSAIVQVESISRFYLDYWVRHPEYFQIFWAIDNQSVIGDLPGEVVAEVARLWKESLGVLSAVLSSAIRQGDLNECDTWEVANILWTTANGLIQSDSIQARRELRGQPLEDVFHDAIRLILQGLATPSSRLGT